MGHLKDRATLFRYRNSVALKIQVGWLFCFLGDSNTTLMISHLVLHYRAGGVFNSWDLSKSQLNVKLGSGKKIIVSERMIVFPW
jgi:hypothetical protein